MRTCEVCGGPAPAAERCTNGRCAKCHRDHCTAGGVTGPGHGRGTVDIYAGYAKTSFRSSGYKVGSMDERCATCGNAFGDHYNGRCPATEGD